MADKPIGFVFNQQLLTFALGAIALFGSMFAGVSWINERNYYESTTNAEIVRLQEQDASNAASNKALSDQVGRLSDSVDDLALTLKEVEVIQRTSPLTGFNTTNLPLR